MSYIAVIVITLWFAFYANTAALYVYHDLRIRPPSPQLWGELDPTFRTLNWHSRFSGNWNRGESNF